MIRGGLSLMALSNTSKIKTLAILITAIQRQKREAQLNQRYRRPSVLAPWTARVATASKPTKESTNRNSAARMRNRSSGLRIMRASATAIKIRTDQIKAPRIPDAVCICCQKFIVSQKPLKPDVHLERPNSSTTYEGTVVLSLSLVILRAVSGTLASLR